MNRETMGYTVCMYHENGGCAATWEESLTDVFSTIQSMEPHVGIVIVKLPYKRRIQRFTIQKPKNLHDSGIYSIDR